MKREYIKRERERKDHRNLCGAHTLEMVEMRISKRADIRIERDKIRSDGIRERES